MSNPVTAWIKSCMETHQDREDWMVERLSENSINAQKLRDERSGPFKMHNAYQQEMRSKPNYRASAATSGLAGKDGGNIGSYRAVRYYQDGYATRRDEILTDIAKNGL
mmetsp:Transcript_23565/g.51041  ORF Transcript_23565/g.51041 Transcript_23565/m.51041 type:complete len:108 (+) Transcript_23565:78-401(+)|eukprot:CAMPEP_0172309886 /NCGR_PEP_ID=MMETSP1058-20130122/10849_1 /TAXON_ID=83371 /ORGANISM="Detonula confervacea, Strain CCMP 353" /LENGTH=107 /DNA_ID=CAMNT_0013022599 /DNA_START=58 /DNA_END=381 /DNA_ORIENTATION=+